MPSLRSDDETHDVERVVVPARSARDEMRGRSVGTGGEDTSDAGQDVDYVNRPPHYNHHPSGIQCFDIVQYLGNPIGTATKYVWRAGEKFDAIEDLDKALWYIRNCKPELFPRNLPKHCVNNIKAAARADMLTGGQLNELRSKYFTELLNGNQYSMLMLVELMQDVI